VEEYLNFSYSKGTADQDFAIISPGDSRFVPAGDLKEASYSRIERDREGIATKLTKWNFSGAQYPELSASVWDGKTKTQSHVDKAGEVLIYSFPTQLHVISGQE